MTVVEAARQLYDRRMALAAHRWTQTHHDADLPDDETAARLCGEAAKRYRRLGGNSHDPFEIARVAGKRPPRSRAEGGLAADLEEAGWI